MKINIKIDPYNYPLIIIAAFAIGVVLAIALGFSPRHSSGGREGSFLGTAPAVVQTIPAGVYYGL